MSLLELPCLKVHYFLRVQCFRLSSGSLVGPCSVDTVLPWERTVICFNLQQKSLWCVVTVRECSVWPSPGWFK